MNWLMCLCRKQRDRFIIPLFALFFLQGCTGIPDNIQPVSSFDVNRYLGTWYEIARLDHSFERGLTQVSATYEKNSDGSISVLNRGYDSSHQEWKQAEGRAVFVGEPNKAHLKVSFFGPFYSSYVVFYLEPDYSVALVSGYNKEYFWILARQPSLTDTQLGNCLQRAQEAGFAVDNLIYPQPPLKSKASVENKI